MTEVKKSDKNYIFYLECSLLFAGLAVSYLTFMYSDLYNVIDNSNIFLSALKNGKLLSFYEYSIERASGYYSANYSLLIYIIFGIWQAPMLVLTKLLGKEYMEWSVSLLWSKLLLVLFMSAVALLIYKIVLLCTQQKKRGILAAFLYMSNVLVCFSILFAGQLEVIATLFMLIGLYFYLKGNMLLFWLAFMISVPLKGFGLFMALPLLLLKEKNLIKVFAATGSMMSLLFVEKFIYRDSLVYKYALQSQNDDVIEGIMGTSIKLGLPFIIWLACYLALLIWTYARSEIKKEEVIFICCFVWNTYMGLSYIRSYWVFLAGTFSALCICVNDRFLKEGILVDTIGGFCYLLMQGAAGWSSVVVYKEAVSKLFLPHIMHIPTENLRYGNFHALFEELNLTVLTPFFSTVYITAVLAIVFLTAPSLQKGKTGDSTTDDFIMLLRPILVSAGAALYIYSFTAVQPPILFNTTGADSYVSENDLITETGTSVLCQKIVVDKETETESLILKFSNPKDNRANRSMLFVQIADSADGEVIAETGIECSKVTNDNDVKLKIKGGKMKPGREYEIRLFAREGVEALKKGTQLFAYLVNSEKSGMANCTFDGQELEGSLYFILR